MVAGSHHSHALGCWRAHHIQPIKRALTIHIRAILASVLASQVLP